MSETLELENQETPEATEPVEAVEAAVELEPAFEPEPEEFIDSFQLFSILESLLFASDRPLSLSTMKQVFVGTNIDTKTLKKSLEELQRIYADPTRGVTLEEVTTGWQLRTKLDNMEFLKRVSKARPFRLSGPALEVLSIIAYKQPIIKNEVDQIRGVESGHLVRALMEKGLVTFEGKTDLPGKPMAYSTTRKFLEIFGLRNLQELPTLAEIDQLLPDGIGDVEEKETLSDVTDSMSQAYVGNYSENEEELGQITDKINAIDTSSEFFEEEKRRQKEKKERDRAQDIREALAVGESVDSKDVKWLERYEAALAEAHAAAQAAALTAESAAQNAEVNSEETPAATAEAEASIEIPDELKVDNPAQKAKAALEEAATTSEARISAASNAIGLALAGLSEESFETAAEQLHLTEPAEPLEESEDTSSDDESPA